MTFFKFPSIENHYRKKSIEFCKEKYPDAFEDLWIVTEKIHGSNVQIRIYPDGGITWGTRNQNVEGNIFGFDMESFIGDNYEIVDEAILHAQEAGEPITLFGELCGKGIQKGVDYGETKRVVFFSAYCGHEESRDLLHSILPDSMKVPVISYGLTFEEAISIDTKFDSKLIALSSKKENICEGVVIQSVLYPSIKFKIVNDEFKQKQSEKTVRVASSEEQWAIDEFILYLTEQRLQAVFSKSGMIESNKQIGMYMKLFMEDAQEEFSQDYPERLDDDLLKTVRKRCNSQAAKLIQAYL